MPSNYKNVLVCPIDWGLGHATRSCPVIEELISRGHNVSIASSGPALAFLKKEFPPLQFHALTGYRPFYQVSGSLIWSLARQSRKFMDTIRREHDETENIIRREGIQAVISDNRFGCWSDHVPNAIITHQLRILAPPIVSWIINHQNRRLLRKFAACWVPDREGMNSMAGEMVHPDGMPVTFIGPLSRFKVTERSAKKYDIIGVVSGPDPQRQILVDRLRTEFTAFGRPALLVHGLPDQEERTEGQLTEVSHLGSMELNRAILESEIIISRSGYSTIMDLEAIGGKAIFIPTPGQPEQEYLGWKLMEKGIAYCVRQEEFDLQKALTESKKFTGFFPAPRESKLQKALDELLA